MKTILKTIVAMTALGLACATLPVRAADSAGPVRLLVIAGGHDFETNQFWQMFRAMPGVAFQTAVHPRAQALWKPEAARNYDVIVLYDMWQKISEEAQADLLALLKQGKGLISLHHSLANYQAWPEWPKIVGGRYYLQDTTVDGVLKRQSTWKHDVQFRVKVADPNHPITRGVKDFDIHDETYGRFDMGPDSHCLLTTEEATSAKNLAWAKTYDAARVVYLQLGHDHLAYENPNYLRLVSQAIQWVARKD